MTGREKYLTPRLHALLEVARATSTNEKENFFSDLEEFVDFLAENDDDIEEKLQGEILIGKADCNFLPEDFEVKIKKNLLCANVCVVGTPGSGKSNFIRLILNQLDNL